MKGITRERPKIDRIASHGLHDAALARLASIVRAADCGRPQDAPEASGLLAISCGLSLDFSDDHEMLAHGRVLYDALHAQRARVPVTQVPGPTAE
ncbi:MAG: chromate resistance protein [Burkholderiales bacterium]|jgi:hypothetical protein|nr:chromate resistance protein [Burkholderiales bacterium]